MRSINIKRKRMYYDKSYVKLARAVDKLCNMTDAEILKLLGKGETEIIIVDNEPHYVDIPEFTPEIPVVFDDYVNNPYSEPIPLTYDEMEGI
jgi:hypothetical protein